MEKWKTLIISAAIIIGLIINAVVLGYSMQRFRKEDRFISVKGFSEREVKADLAVWTIRCRVAGNNLSEGSKTIEEVKNKVIVFLKENGIEENEIIQKDLIVNDKMAQEYGDYNSDKSFRFIIDKIIQVRSADVDNIQKVSRMTDELLKTGVVISSRNEYEAPVRYYFTKLNDIKPDMLTEATENARKAAIQFVSESKSKLGKLKKANQGLFSIVDRDESLGTQAEGGYYMANSADIIKKVRVVVNVEYSIE